MTKAETMKIVAVLFGSFPNSRFSEQNFESYAEGLLDLDAAACGKAAQRLIRTNKFLPSIAELREASTAQSHGPRKTGAEAYGELKDAVQRYGQYPEVRWVGGEMRVQSPWPPLQPDVEKAMRQTWGTWSACCSETGIEAPDRARFIAAYDGLAERERQDLVSGQALPAPGATRTRLPAPLATQAPRRGPDASARRVDALVASVGAGPKKAREAAPTPPATAELVPRKWTADELDTALSKGGK